MCLKEKLAEYVVTPSDSFNKQTEVQKQYKPKRGPSHITSHTRQVLNLPHLLICSFLFSLRYRELLQTRYMQAFFIFSLGPPPVLPASLRINTYCTSIHANESNTMQYTTLCRSAPQFLKCYFRKGMTAENLVQNINAS